LEAARKGEGEEKKERTEVSSNLRTRRMKGAQYGTNDKGDDGTTSVADSEVDLVLKLEGHPIQEEEEEKEERSASATHSKVPEEAKETH
jgi:hypothetical protein